MSDLVSLLHGNSFVVSDKAGDITPSPRKPTGVFAFDTRFISTWILTVNGERMHVLSTDDLQYYEARFYLVPGEPTHYVDAKLSVIRHRTIGASFAEQLIVLNNEKQRILLTGIVRPDDLAADNTVPSWRVAGANIQLVGKGMLSRKAADCSTVNIGACSTVAEAMPS